jgi:cation transport regulator
MRSFFKSFFERKILFYNLTRFKMTTKIEKAETLKSTDDIPDNLKEILPAHAQHIYMKSHNRAVQEYKDPKSRKYGGSLEEVAHRVAWSAVKSMYEKDEKSGKWKIKSGKTEKDEPEYEEDPNA